MASDTSGKNPSDVYNTKPFVEESLAGQWPKPPGVRRYDWQAWTPKERSDWLVEHAFEESDGVWKPRTDVSDTKTAHQVLEAVSTMHTTAAAVETFFGGIVDDYNMSDGSECPGCGEPVAAGSKYCPSCGHSFGGEGSDDSVFTPLAVIAIIGIVLIAIVMAALAVQMFGGESEGDSVAAEASTDQTVPVTAPSSESPSTSVGSTTSLQPTSSTSTTTTSTLPPDTSIALGFAPEGSSGTSGAVIVDHIGQVLINIEGSNRTAEAEARGVASGPWVSSYRDESQSPSGHLSLDIDNRTLIGQITETWTCVGTCLNYSDYFDIAWTGEVIGHLEPDGTGWLISGTVNLVYSAQRGDEEGASDCGGTPCWTCADQYCMWDSGASSTVPIEGRIDGTSATLSFSDRLAEDIGTMDFSDLRTTEFFMSRLVLVWTLAEPVPTPGN